MAISRKQAQRMARQLLVSALLLPGLNAAALMTRQRPGGTAPPQAQPASMRAPGTGGAGDGQAQAWGEYTEHRERVYEPVFREICDRFKYANLEDPDRQQLVSMLADLGDLQLTAPANQYTLRSRALYHEREAILAVLELSGMPTQRPTFDEAGMLLDLIRNPAFQPDDLLEDEDAGNPDGGEDGEDGGEEGDLEDEDAENALEEWEDGETEEGEEGPDDGTYYDESGLLYDRHGQPEYLTELGMDLLDPIQVDRLAMQDDYPSVWYVPMTPDECFGRLEEISSTLRLMNEDRARAISGGYFYDSGPLLDYLEMAPEERPRGDMTHLYPFFYRHCFRVSAITPEDLHGHIQAVNANQVQEKHGGNFLNPNDAVRGMLGSGNAAGPQMR